MDDCLVENQTEKFDIVNKFFTIVFTKDNPNYIPWPGFNDDYNGSMILNVNSAESDIEEILKALKIYKSTGPDNLHLRILYELASVLAKPLYKSFRKSIDTGKLSVKWNDADVVSIFKFDDKSLPKTYRLISLTSIICKCLEELIKNATVALKENNNLFSTNQHGFIRERSFVTQVSEYIHVEKWAELGYSGFYLVPCQRMLKKIYSYGIRAKI